MAQLHPAALALVDHQSGQHHQTLFRQQRPKAKIVRSWSASLHHPVFLFQYKGNTFKRLPRASRECAGRKLVMILEAIVHKNDHTSWNRLLCFSVCCLRHPDRGGCHTRSLATAINQQTLPLSQPPSRPRPTCCERLQCPTAQDAFLLLKHSCALPKLLNNLRTAPFLSPVLQELDKLLKSTEWHHKRTLK